ncbi:acid-sensing ion channel 1C-like [Amphiura filiformis]|uniref:acid-sensing ion channel 1C-like n=1 Tax=Amphiura filiformis TaxID=82378 RepID=UPI003B21181E
MGDSDVENESLEQKCAQSTTFHGLSSIADKSKPTWLRIAWILAVATCMGVCIWQICLRFEALYDINTIVSSVYPNELEFPAVTICNFNRYRTSQIRPEDLPFIRYTQFAVENYDLDLESWHDYPDYNTTFNFTEFTNRAGFILDDDTLLDCNWRGKECFAENFTHVFTSYGNCWTFNSGKDNRGNELPILTEELPGSKNGLNVIINIQQLEYSESFAGNIQAGLKVLVHDQADPPHMDSLGSAVPPGFYGFIGIRKKTFINLEPPWGTCNRSKTLQYYNKYTLSGCFIECSLTHIISICQCKPLRYPGTAEVCTPHVEETCVRDVLSQLSSGSLGICSCPIPCNYTEFATSISYGAIPNQSVADWFGLLFNITDEFQRLNYVAIDVYYEELHLQTFNENKAMTVSSLISDIGGNVGLFLGGSILTFAEIIDYVLLKCGFSRAEKKRGLSGKKECANPEKEQHQGHVHYSMKPL